MTELHAPKRLTADFAWILSGNLVYAACQWGILVVLAKLGTPEQVGEYALGMAIAAPVMLFANLQLRVLLASDVTGRFALSRYLTFRLVSLAAALLVVIGIAVVSQPDWRLRGIVSLVGLSQAQEFVSDAYYGFMQRQERMDRISASLLLKGPLALAALSGAMYVSHSVAWAVTGLVLGRLAVFVLWESRLGFAGAWGREFRIAFPWESRELLTLLRIALPLGVISMLVSLNSNIPRYFIEAYSGRTELGVFSAIASLLTGGNLVVAALGQSMFLPVARACASRDRARYRGYALRAAALGGVLGGAAVLASSLFGRDILAHLFRPEYGERADILVRLMIAGTIAFVASGLGYVITAARSLLPQIPLLLTTASASAAVSGWSIPKHGLSGAANAALAAALLQLVGTVVIFFRTDHQMQRSSAISSGGLAVPELQRVGAERT
jgi:O-antigen/teichoic acid export membrane protein